MRMRSRAWSALTETFEASALKTADSLSKSRRRGLEVFGVLVACSVVAASLVADAAGFTVVVLDATIVQAVVLALVVGVWIGLYGTLILTKLGQEYLGEDASKGLTQDNIDSRMDSLTIAGLVLAGFAVGPASTNDKAAATMLVASLCAFMVAWAAGFFPDRMSSTTVRDGMHWIGLAALLTGVHAIAVGVLGISGPGILAIIVASMIVLTYSTMHARAHFKGAFLKQQRMRDLSSMNRPDDCPSPRRSRHKPGR